MKRYGMNLVVACASLSLAGCVVWPQGQVVRQQVQAPQAYQPTQPLGIEDVKALAKGGVGDDLVISQIRNSRTVYHLGAADIIALKGAGVGEKVIDFMINTPSSAAVAPTATTVASEPSPAMVESVVVAPGPAYVWWGPWPWYWWGWHGGYWHDGYGHGGHR